MHTQGLLYRVYFLRCDARLRIWMKSASALDNAKDSIMAARLIIKSRLILRF